MDFIGLVRMLDQFSILIAFLRNDLTRPTSSRTVDQSVNTPFVEASRPPGECALENTIQRRHLLIREAKQQSFHGATPHITTLGGSSLGGHIQFSKRAVLGIGQVRTREAILPYGIKRLF